MIDYIGSETYKKFLKDENIQLKPMDKAALIMRSDVSMDDKIASIKELLTEFPDEIMEKELEHLSANWNYTRANFAYISDDIVYRTLSSTPKKVEYFTNLEKAVQKGIDLCDSFIIEKLQIHYEIVRNSLNPVTEKIATAFYRANGKLNNISPVLVADNSTECTLADHYIGFCHPFYRGVFIKRVGYNEFGISCDLPSRDEQVRYIEKNRMTGEIDDLTDTVSLYFVWNDGELTEDFMSPTELEIVSEEQLPDQYKNILHETALLLKGQGSLINFQNYENELRRKSEDEKYSKENPMT